MPKGGKNPGGRPRNRRKKQQALIVLSQPLFERLQGRLEEAGSVVVADGQVVDYARRVCYAALNQVAYPVTPGETFIV